MEDKFAKLLDKKEVVFKYFAISSDLAYEKYYSKAKMNAIEKVKVLSETYDADNTLSTDEGNIFKSHMKISANNLITTGTNGKYQSFYLKDEDELCPPVMVFNKDEFVVYATEKIAYNISKFKEYYISVAQMFVDISVDEMVKITGVHSELFHDEYLQLELSSTPISGHKSTAFQALHNCGKAYSLVEYVMDHSGAVSDHIVYGAPERHNVRFRCRPFVKNNTEYYVVPYDDNGFEVIQKPPVAGAVTSGFITTGLKI